MSPAPVAPADDELPNLRDLLGDAEHDDAAQHQCADCKTWSPPARTAHTLISAAHGWRLSRHRHRDGTYGFQWRCPPCWLAFKQKPGAGTSTASLPTARSRLV